MIYAFWTNPQKALRKKNTYYREASEIEVFAESVLTALVMTFLMVKGKTAPGKPGALIVGESYSFDYYMFFFSYSISILTAPLGLAKTLKIGPCRTLPGPLAEGRAVGKLFVKTRFKDIKSIAVFLQ